MYLVRGNEIVAYNDDYTGLASEIIYTPTATDTYRLVIRAYTTSTPGVCDLFQGVDGAPPTQLEGNITFAGTFVRVRWKQGEWFETGRPVVVNSGGFSVNTGTVGSLSGDGPDPYLFLIYPNSAVGSKMYLDDDGAGFPDSKIVPPDGGSGTVILGVLRSLHRWRVSAGRCRSELQGSMDVTRPVGVRRRTGLSYTEPGEVHGGVAPAEASFQQAEPWRTG